jgi:hypothetical protein
VLRFSSRWDFAQLSFQTRQASQRRGHLLEVRLLVLRAENTQPSVDRERWDDSASEAGAGDIRLRAWGENAESLIDLVLDPIRKLPVGQAPKIEQTKRIRVRGFHFIFRLDRAPPRPKSDQW